MSVEFHPPQSDLTVPFNGGYVVADQSSLPPPDVAGRKELQKQLKKCVSRIATLQRKLYADNRFSVLLVFQAMDAAGKDGTIRAVMSGVNPAGCNVHSFKKPSDEELDHDFLWRNESALWSDRFESIRQHEMHLARNGTVILKFWLNVSKEEQKARFMKRLTTPDRYWKFSKYDLSARAQWDEYMEAYESLLNETSRAHAPWFALPADNKPYMRLQVAQIIENTLGALPLAWPEKSPEELARFGDHIDSLNNEAG